MFDENNHDADEVADNNDGNALVLYMHYFSLIVSALSNAHNDTFLNRRVSRCSTVVH